MADKLLEARKYPGRTRVMSRQDARDYIYRQRLPTQPDRFRCGSPIRIPAVGLPSPRERGGPLTFEIEGRCRQCENCLGHRRRLWTARAIAEIGAARRTWFGTLTVAPEHRVALGWRAEASKLRAGGETVSSLDASERYRLFASSLSVEVTKWLKRVREVTNGPLRYLLVFEAHKDGWPHCHLLVHEHGEPITKRKLENQWRYGFSHWRLVGEDPKAAQYVCKYLAKDALTRVRASRHYGQSQLIATLTERMMKVRDAVAIDVGSEERSTQSRRTDAPPSPKDSEIISPVVRVPNEREIL